VAELSWARVVAATLLVALSLAAAAYGGYSLGKPDDILEEVRAAAIADGREAGARKGAKEGYDHGYEATRDRAHGRAYAAAYRAAYASQFQRADLALRQPVEVPEPR
jgi:hypothetical protein